MNRESSSLAATKPVPAGAGSHPALAVGLLAFLAGTKLLLHLLLGGRYGYFRDELYFLDCGRHLDWGYVDHATMIGLVARIALLLGGSDRAGHAAFGWRTFCSGIGRPVGANRAGNRGIDTW